MKLDPDRLFPHPLDGFQREAFRSLEEGRSVIVCAPTGSGKTVVAEYAIHLALARGRRCFYTTPLKALSNQKFHDLRRQLGEERVGLLTGDTSVNRNAPVVVMTTEVYRNMLYGTALGEVERNLAYVESVVLDECHFMNDVDRGTVWEESIIYSPPPIQLVALSATVANAADLRDWIGQIHGPVDLVVSEHRPVPLRHSYHLRGELYRLLMGGGRLNPKLKAEAQGDPRAWRRDRTGRGGPRPRQEFPERVVERLDREGMVPAIYFLFSRKKCDEAVRRSSRAVRLTREQHADLQRAIAAALAENPGLATHPHLEALRGGVAAHHAGLLPSWKGLVEQLFQRGLLKVVYATETLAAGINMPARTTVIGAISKYSDEGHRLLTASEFLQMSGRAGRRGMDTEGNVVIVHHPLEPVEDAARLAQAPPDPLISRFSPGYGMVLNLLQRHSLEESRRLVERSFGQFVADRAQGPLHEEAAALSRRLPELTRPMCPGSLGDLPAYRKLREQARAFMRQARGLSGGTVRGKVPPEVRAALEDLKARREENRARFEASPCHGCPVQAPCAAQHTEWTRAARRKDEVERAIRRTSTPSWRQFTDLCRVLEAAEYLEDHRPTRAGELASTLRATNVLFLGEVVFTGLLEGLEAAELAAVMSALVAGDTRAAPDIQQRPSRHAEAAIREAVRLAQELQELQDRHGVDAPLWVNPAFSGLAESWARGADWAHLRAYMGMEEGDLIRALRRTLDLCRQFAHAPHMPEALAQVCREAELALDRDEVHEALVISD